MVFRVSPLDDQVFAGALMWAFGTFVYAVPAVVLTVRLLSGESTHARAGSGIHLHKPAEPIYQDSRPEVI
jgi:hypothetical protein